MSEYANIEQIANEPHNPRTNLDRIRDWTYPIGISTFLAGFLAGIVDSQEGMSIPYMIAVPLTTGGFGAALGGVINTPDD